MQARSVHPLLDWLATLDEPPEKAVAVLRDALDHEEPLVREHAAWALEQRVKSVGPNSYPSASNSMP